MCNLTLLPLALAQPCPPPGCHVPSSWIAHGLPNLHVSALRPVLRLDGRRDWQGRDVVQLEPGCPGRQRGPPCLQVSFRACIVLLGAFTDSQPATCACVNRRNGCRTCQSSKPIDPPLPPPLVFCVLCPHRSRTRSNPSFIRPCPEIAPTWYSLQGGGVTGWTASSSNCADCLRALTHPVGFVVFRPVYR